MIDCGEKIRLLRINKHLTQEQLAKRIGVTKGMVSAYETASKAPSLDVLVRLSRVLGVSVDYLVCVDAPKYVDISALDDSSAALITALVDKLAQNGRE